MTKVGHSGCCQSRAEEAKAEAPCRRDIYLRRRAPRVSFRTGAQRNQGMKLDRDAATRAMSVGVKETVRVGFKSLGVITHADLEREIARIEASKELFSSLEQGVLSEGEVASAFADRVALGFLHRSGVLSIEDASVLSSELRGRFAAALRGASRTSP